MFVLLKHSPAACSLGRQAVLLSHLHGHVSSQVRRMQTSLSISSSSFFGSSSGRAARRRRRLRQQQQPKHGRSTSIGAVDSAQNSGEEVDTRTVRELLFPTPDWGDDDTETNKTRYPQTVAGWRELMSHVWKEYSLTWEGFMDNNTVKNEAKAEMSADLEKHIRETREDVTENVQNNVKFLQEESDKLRQTVQEQTGIYTKEDLRRVAGEMMQLATECVKEFMAGYRKGRDDEAEKMITEYFQGLEDAANKAKRRKPKRRIIMETANPKRS